MTKMIAGFSAAIAALLLLVACRQSTSQTHDERDSVATRSASASPAPSVAPTAPAPATTSLSSDRLNAVVDALLRAQYPAGFDARHGCWKAHYGDGDEAMDYCMRPLPASLVTEGGERVVYVAMASAANIEIEAGYRYGATDPGMFDAFRIAAAADGATAVTASAKGLAFGSAGDCGCADADLVPLGPDVHGWVFSSGSTQQGVTTATHSLVAPVGARFMDVGGIPHYVEGEQDVEYRIAIGSDHPIDGWFPLTVSKFRKDQKLADHIVHFDRTAQRYLMPQSF